VAFTRAADTYDLSDLATSSLSDADAAGFGPGVAALKSVSMLNNRRFPVAELLENSTLDEVSTKTLLVLAGSSTFTCFSEQSKAESRFFFEQSFHRPSNMAIVSV